jgi:microcystin-dependent protein
MAQPYVGEIRMFAGNYAPAGWAFCDGQLLQISENGVLFALIGTTYGGDGQNTFMLPNLQGRVPIHMGTGPAGITSHLAAMAGVEAVTLTTQQIPSHSHAFMASTADATSSAPETRVLGASASINLYLVDDPDTSLAAVSGGQTGGNQPHENMQPSLCVNYIISLFGIFPSPT